MRKGSGALRTNDFMAADQVPDYHNKSVQQPRLHVFDHRILYIIIYPLLAIKPVFFLIRIHESMYVSVEIRLDWVLQSELKIEVIHRLFSI